MQIMPEEMGTASVTPEFGLPFQNARLEEGGNGHGFPSLGVDKDLG